MTNQDSTYTLAKDILKKVGGDVTKSYDSTYSICLAILEKLGGDITKKYDSTYSIVEAILPLAGEGGKCNLDVLKVIANGNYNPGEGFDGFSSVEVNVPLPVIEDNKTQKIVQNGDTIIIPTEGNDAMKQATVTIEVPTGEAIDARKAVTINKNGITNINPSAGFGGIEGADVTVEVTPDLEPLNKTFTENGTKSFVSTKDGYSSVEITTNVQPKLEEVSDKIVSNGVKEFTPSVGKDGLSKVTITTEVIPELEPLNETITENGTKSFVSAKDGYSSVDITTNVQPKLQVVEDTITINGIKEFKPTGGNYGLSSVKITTNVQPKLQDKTEDIINNGTFNIVPDLDFDGMKKATVNVNVPEQKPEEKGNETITANGLHQYIPTAGHVFNAFDVNVEIPLEENKTQYIFKNGVHTVTPNEGNTAMKQATITVEVPEQKPEEVGNETIVSNGKVKFTPTEGSVFSEMNVDVQVPTPTFETEELTATENKVYTPTKDGYSKVTVDVPLPALEERTTKEIVRNGNYTVSPTINPATGLPYDGMKLCDVNVNIPEKTFITEEKTVEIVQNGQTIVDKSTDKDGMTKVTINTNVPVPKVQSKKVVNVSSNGTTIVKPDIAMPPFIPEGYDVMKEVEIRTDVRMPSIQNNKTIDITSNGTIEILPDKDPYGAPFNSMKKVTANVNVPPKSKPVIYNLTENRTHNDPWIIDGGGTLAPFLTNSIRVNTGSVKDFYSIYNIFRNYDNLEELYIDIPNAKEPGPGQTIEITQLCKNCKNLKEFTIDTHNIEPYYQQTSIYLDGPQFDEQHYDPNSELKVTIKSNIDRISLYDCRNMKYLVLERTKPLPPISTESNKMAFISFTNCHNLVKLPPITDPSKNDQLIYGFNEQSLTGLDSITDLPLIYWQFKNGTIYISSKSLVNWPGIKVWSGVLENVYGQGWVKVARLHINCPKLSVESLDQIATNIQGGVSDYYEANVYFDSTSYNKLTPEIRSKFTSKGWTIKQQ